MNFFSLFTTGDLPYEVMGECVSAILSLVLLINIITSFTWSSKKERYFFIAVLGCFLSCVSDVFSVYTIAHYQLFPIIVCKLISSVYFITLVIIPFALVGYAYEVADPYREKESHFVIVIELIFSAYVIIMLINILTGWVFTFKPGIGYIRGPLKYITYIMSLFAMIVVEIIVFTHRKNMASKVFRTVVLYPVVAIAILLIQFFNPEVLCTGTASIAGLLFAYISVQDELSQYDNETGLMTEKKLEKHLQLKNASGYLYVLSIDNMNSIQCNMQIEQMNQMLLNIGRELTKRFQRYCYHISTDRFAAIGTLEEVERYAKEISEYIRIVNETNPALPYPMEVYCVGVGYSEGENTYANVMEIVNNLLRKCKKEGYSELKLCDDATIQDMERKNVIFKILKRELNLESEQFQVWYQPIYSIKDKKFIYMEALSRLQHTELGNISPAEFIEVAESKGLISQLGQVAFEKICKYISDNRDTVQGVSVNFSIDQMSNPEICRQILDTLSRFKLEPSKIMMEITESLEMYDSDIVQSNMMALSSYGIKFYLDDFGTGFSNLAKVISLPFDTIKFDRSLVLLMDKSSKNYDLFKNFVNTFKTAGFKVLVEGVEDEKQRARVESVSTDYIQGFLLSKPLTGDDCLALLKSQEEE